MSVFFSNRTSYTIFTIFSSLSTLVERGGAPSPLPLPTPSSLANSPPLPPALPSCRVKYVLGCVMGGNGSAPGGCRQHNTTCLTATPSAAGRLPPPLRSVSSRLLDLYHECVVNGGWARVLYDARSGTEKFIFICKTEPTPALTTSTLGAGGVLTVAGYTAAEDVFATTAIEENAIAASV